VRVRLSPRALDDLAEITDWIARDDPARARTFVDELREACRDLGPFPRAYPPAPQFGETARRRLYGNYLIIYDLDDAGVIVLTVVHAARDLDRLN
jgi:toxin ParE1/3/4